MAILKSQATSNFQNQSKVYGRPLQDLYQNLIQTPGTPSQPVLIRQLCTALKKQNLQYHPRTVKRQLLGNIEYVPQALEKALVSWIKSQDKPIYKKLLLGFQNKKTSLESSADRSLYVSPQFFNSMANAYLVLHKNLSRRRLALLLQSELKSKSFSIGLETLQAAIAGKTKKIRKILENELKNLFSKEGYADKTQIEDFLKKVEGNGKKEIEKVAIGDLPEVVDAYLIRSEGISKRQLALRIQERLKKKGYVYHLSSIQSVIEGKTQKTKQVILETVNEMLKEEGFSDPQRIRDYLDSLPESQKHWHHYISAEKIPGLVQDLLKTYPSLTRRQLALALKEDLTQKNFDFSLNTLQYILAGKTQRTRGIVAELLKDYSQKKEFQERWVLKQHSPAGKKGRPSLGRRLLQTWEKWKQVEGPEREALYREFLSDRELLIKKRWALRHPQRRLRKNAKPQRDRDLYENLSSEESYAGSDASSPDAEVSLELRSQLDRLVS